MSDLSSFLDKTKHANVVPVVETMPADLLTPLSVYLKLSADAKYSFLLESVEGGKSLARYSFIGADPESVLDTGSEDIFEYLKSHFAELHAISDADLPAFIGGAIGYLGFDCSEWFEPSLRRENAAANDAALMFFRSTVAFDHAKQVIKIISLVFTDEAADEDSLQLLFDAAAERNRKIKQRLEHGDLYIPANTDGSQNSAVSSNWKREDFESAVSQIKELINAGEAYQVVLSQCFTRQTNASPVAIYRAIRSINPSPYMFLLKFDEKAIVGASPEMLVRCENDRLEYRPIAGTRPRGKTTEEDEALASHGFMGAAAREAARVRALRELVLPCARALLGNSMGTESPATRSA